MRQLTFPPEATWCLCYSALRFSRHFEAFKRFFLSLSLFRPPLTPVATALLERLAANLCQEKRVNWLLRSMVGLQWWEEPKVECRPRLRMRIQVHAATWNLIVQEAASHSVRIRTFFELKDSCTVFPCDWRIFDHLMESRWEVERLLADDLATWTCCLPSYTQRTWAMNIATCPSQESPRASNSIPMIS